MYRVIVADDEPVMRKALITLVDWVKLDCEIVSVAMDGQAVIDCIAKTNPHIIITDIKMPIKSGIDVAKYVYENRLNIKIILLTAYADFSYAQQAITYGVSHYVTKTGAVSGIIEAVEKCKRAIGEEHGGAQPAERAAAAFIKSVLEGSVYESGEILSEQQRLGLELGRYYLAVLDVVFACGRTLSASGGTESISARNLETLITDVFAAADVWFIPTAKDRYCVVINNPVTDVAENCAKIAETLFRLAGGRVYMGISREHHSCLKLTEAFTEALAALDGRFSCDVKYVYSFGVAEKYSDRSEQVVKLVNRLATIMWNASDGEASKLLQQIFALQQEENAEDVRSQGLALVNACRLRLAQMGGSAAELNQVSAVYADKLRWSVFFSGYCETIREFVSEYLKALSETMSYKGDIVLMAQEYIDKNYLKSITLTQIAESININASYLSRIFKVKTGLSIVDTINRKKIERACELLDAGNFKIYEIAASLGIDDTTYFSHLFKKYMGLSPKNYQERRRRTN